MPAGTNGSTTIRLYGPNATCGLANGGTPIAAATSTVQVTNFNPASPTYTSASFTPTAVGTYNWTAQFTSSTTEVDDTGRSDAMWQLS